MSIAAPPPLVLDSETLALAFNFDAEGKKNNNLASPSARNGIIYALKAVDSLLTGLHKGGVYGFQPPRDDFTEIPLAAMLEKLVTTAQTYSFTSSVTEEKIFRLAEAIRSKAPDTPTIATASPEMMVAASVRLAQTFRLFAKNAELKLQTGVIATPAHVPFL